MNDILPPSDRIVVTGGPGSGKSTLVAALAERGFRTMPEAGRAIIRCEVARGGSALPWADREAFARRMLAFDIRNWRAAGTGVGPAFYDRGIVDVAGYLTLCDLPVPPVLRRTSERRRYHTRVFIAPPWPEIFHQDEERRQDIAEAVATFEAMQAAYRSFDYTLIELPKVPVAERVAFVLETLAAAGRSPIAVQP